MVSVTIFPGAKPQIITGGTSQIALYGPMIGGFISNPASPADQNLAAAEILYVSLTGPANIVDRVGTFPVSPGETFRVPDGNTLDVWVNAVSTGHRFSSVVFHETAPYPPVGPLPVFPPSGPTSVTRTIGSYLYVQYNDDSDLQAFVRAYNEMSQEYVDFFNDTPLPYYVADTISDGLLDWVAAGLYGLTRPALPIGNTTIVGPFNTIVLNGDPHNFFNVVGSDQFYATTDDTFKRILTWHLYTGDGRYFNIRWLKRRIQRFLTGVNGSGGQTDQTYDVSVLFGSGDDVNIDVGQYAPLLKSGIDSGALELPFSYNFIVTTG